MKDQKFSPKTFPFSLFRFHLKEHTTTKNTRDFSHPIGSWLSLWGQKKKKTKN